MRSDGATERRGAREFTWWGPRLAQTVRAEPPEHVFGCWWTRLCGVTHFLADVPDPPMIHKWIEWLNMTAAMNACVWNPVETALQMFASERHPVLGGGALFVLRLPPSSRTMGADKL